MKQEYKDIIQGTLNGFLEGNAKGLERVIAERLKTHYNVIPQVCEVTLIQPYAKVGKNYPVIIISTRIEDESWTLVRDCQEEADHSDLNDEDAGFI